MFDEGAGDTVVGYVWETGSGLIGVDANGRGAILTGTGVTGSSVTSFSTADCFRKAWRLFWNQI